MKSQVRQFLKLFLVVIILIHVVIGGLLLTSWLTGREHANGSVEPAAAQHQEQ